ncbi:MAG: hypothetical protein R2800_02450 [Flavipsychrobacter sp.]
MQRILHSSIAVLLSIVLLFGTTPKEYIHLFADHVDTEHRHHEGHYPVFETEHHHCSFLSFTLSPFQHANNEVTFKTYKPQFIIHQSVAVIHLIPCSVPSSPSRGPPVTV